MQVQGNEASQSERPEELTIRDPGALATLYDPIRYQVFRALSEPRSVPQVAAQLGVPPNRLYYHVRRLIDAGLIVHMDARVSGNHMERVYAHAAERMSLGGEVRMQEATSSVGAILDEAFNELKGALRSHEAGEFGEDPAGVFAWHTAPLSEEQARAFERRFDALVAEFSDAEKASRGSGGSRRYAMLGVFSPIPDREGTDPR